jgi:hypothetical protein
MREGDPGPGFSSAFFLWLSRWRVSFVAGSFFGRSYFLHTDFAPIFCGSGSRLSRAPPIADGVLGAGDLAAHGAAHYFRDFFLAHFFLSLGPLLILVRNCLTGGGGGAFEYCSLASLSRVFSLGWKICRAI